MTLLLSLLSKDTLIQVQNLISPTEGWIVLTAVFVISVSNIRLR